MKIAIPSTDADLSAQLDPRFGRAKGFFIFDTKSGESVHMSNTQNLNALQGAGIQAAENVISQGVEAVLTGHCGPKAFRTLQAAGVKVYLGVQGSVKEVIERFKKGELKEAQSSDVNGHW